MGPEDFLANVEAIVESKIQSITVNQLASEIGIHPSHLYKKIKHLSNCSPSIYIRRIRLEKAKVFLINSTLSISEIAFKVGFNEVAYFSECFRIEFNCTPSKYKLEYFNRID